MGKAPIWGGNRTGVPVSCCGKVQTLPLDFLQEAGACLSFSPEGPTASFSSAMALRTVLKSEILIAEICPRLLPA